MIWTNSAEDWSKRKKNSRQLWKKQRQLWRWKKTKFFVLNLNLHKLSKRLIDVLLRKKRSSITLGRIMLVPWILLVLQLKLSNVPREKAFVLRNNWKEKSMSLKLALIMPTRLTQKDLSPSSATRASCVKQSNCMRMKPVHVHRSQNKLESLSARLLLYQERLRRAKPFWMVQSVLSVNSREILLMPDLQSTICRPSMDVT